MARRATIRLALLAVVALAAAVGPAAVASAIPGATYSCTPAPNDCRVASFSTVSLRGSHRFDKHTELYFSVNNVFDKIAPLDPAAYINMNFNPSFHLGGAIGRTFDIGVRHDF